MVLNKLRNFRYGKIERAQFVPTEDDIKEVKKLAKRLKGKNNAQTLNNILEWQERNITYWTERGYLESSIYLIMLLGYLFIVVFISIPVFTFLFVVLIKVLHFPQTLSAISSIILTALVFLWITIKANTLVKLVYLILWSFPLYELIKIVLLESPTTSNISTLLNFTIFNWIIFGIAIFSLSYLFIIYRPLVRNEKSLKNRFKEILNLINSTFKTSLSTFEILKYKKAVCRDYAKLTASLLLNLYPKNKILFFTFRGHIAAGIEIDKKIYILDQKLPILNEVSWLARWNRKDATKLELKRKNRKYSIEYVEKISLKETAKYHNFKGLIKKMERAIKSKKRKVVYILKGGTKIYDIKDDIVKESLSRKIKLMLENEMVGNFSRIKEIKIRRRDRDILLDICLGD